MEENTRCQRAFSWLKDGFLDEWENAVEALAAQGESLVIMGDFNNPANTKGYQAILDSKLLLRDTYAEADVKEGENTIEADIDGWEGNKDALRIDFIFATKILFRKQAESCLMAKNAGNQRSFRRFMRSDRKLGIKEARKNDASN